MVFDSNQTPSEFRLQVDLTPGLKQPWVDRTKKENTEGVHFERNSFRVQTFGPT